MFKPQWAGYITPAYGILEGLFIGGISAFFNAMFANSYPNIILHAVGLTLGVAVGAFLGEILGHFVDLERKLRIEAFEQSGEVGGHDAAAD
jgi:uncharacterized YccA/Bax inhibitor family protein